MDYLVTVAAEVVPEAAEEVLVREMTEVEVSGPPSGVLSRSRKRRLDPGLRIWST